MARIIIPTTPCVDPARLITEDELEVFIPQINAAALDAPGTDVNGVKDTGAYHTGSPAGSASEGNSVAYTNTIIESNGAGSLARLNTLLVEVERQDWAENGSNPRILEALAVAGYDRTNDRKTSWCAAFMSWALVQAGFEGLRTGSSQAYKSYGSPVDWRTWSNVRKNDIIVFKSRKGPGGHVGFVDRYIPSTNRVRVFGGNQADRVKYSNFSVNGNLYVTDVRRITEISDIPDTGPTFDEKEFLSPSKTLSA